MLIAELAVERFVSTVLPRLARIDERRLDLDHLQPAEDRPRHKLGTVVRAQIPWRAMHAHELRQHLDDASGSNPTGHVDGETLTRELVDDRQALQRAPVV